MFSNYLNHHQLPFCLAMEQLTGGKFTFVATEPVSAARLKMGYRDMDRDYNFVLRSYEDAAAFEKARDLALTCDVMIFGSAPNEFIEKRLFRRPAAVTFRYSERLFKETAGKVNRFSLMHYYSFLCSLLQRRKNYYLLAASAYAPIDYMRMGFGKKRYLKWGYFPECAQNTLEKLQNKKAEKLRIIWAGRMIEWKHPEYAVEAAGMLRDDGVDFELRFIGDGVLLEDVKACVRRYGLQDKVVFTGSIPVEEVRQEMEKSHILLFTSDWNEGWGAVLNEGMSSACIAVASHAIGSVPYLIHDGENGAIYQSGDVFDLYRRLKVLAEDPVLREKMAANAYRTVTEQWNACTAAQRLVAFSKKLLCGESGECLYKDGPCSTAELLKETWRQSVR